MVPANARASKDQARIVIYAEGTRGLADAPDITRAGTRRFPAVVSSRNARDRRRIRAGVDGLRRGDRSRAPCVFVRAERPTGAPDRFIISSRRARAGADFRRARSSCLGNVVPTESMGIRGDCLLRRHRRRGGVRACTSARGATPGCRRPHLRSTQGRQSERSTEPTQPPTGPTAAEPMQAAPAPAPTPHRHRHRHRHRHAPAPAPAPAPGTGTEACRAAAGRLPRSRPLSRQRAAAAGVNLQWFSGREFVASRGTGVRQWSAGRSNSVTAVEPRRGIACRSPRARRLRALVFRGADHCQRRNQSRRATAPIADSLRRGPRSAVPQFRIVP